jgi:hypothetical protein
MRKAVLFLVLILCLSGCRTSKNINSDYKEQETSSQSIETSKNEEEKAEWVQKEERETITVGASEKIEFFPPTQENPAGGSPKTIEWTFYTTGEKTVNEITTSYEKKLSEKDVVIENLKREIAALELKTVESDSRPIQKSEWLWVGISFFIVLAICGLVFYLCKKKKTVMEKIIKKIV